MALAAHESNSHEKMVPRLEGKTEEQNLLVGLRIRPMNEDEIIDGATPIGHKVANNVVVLMDPTEDPDDILRANRSREKTFVFDVTFDGSSSQHKVYEKTTKFLIPNVVNGYNATVFAYGATGAGKTYTMLGTPEEQGIMARTLNDLFKEMDKSRDDMAYKVTVSFLEIYNEMIRDLLNPSSGYLELREDTTGVQVSGLSRYSAKSSREIMDILIKGNKQRTQEPTAANKTSSRSHAVLQITVRQKNRIRDTTQQEVRVGKLFLIDLAGSERAANTQNRGKRLVEGAHINRSLLALGNCINALSDKNAHKYINYRDSKLTRLLKDALGGNCKTVMIATISPASIHYEESRNTLLYADRAKNIKTKVRRNVMDVSYHIAQYSNIISELRVEIKRLKHKLDLKAEMADIHSDATDAHSGKIHEVGRLKDHLVQVFNHQMALRRSLMELDNKSMEISIEQSKNNFIVQKWEREKAVSVKRRNSEDIDLEAFAERDKMRELAGLDTEEPEDVNQARTELHSLQKEEERTQRGRDGVLKELDQARDKATKIEETLPTLGSTKDQQEILRLLCKVHELELENIQMQSSCLVRNMEIRQQEMVLSQYKQRHNLADELIQQQKSLIDTNNVLLPKDLEELYELYNSQASAIVEPQLNLPDIHAYKNTSMSSLAKKQVESDSVSELEEAGVQLPKIFVPYDGANSVARRKLLRRSSMYLHKLEESDPLFSKSPRAMQLAKQTKSSKSTTSLSPTPLVPNPTTNPTRQKSIVTLSSRSTVTTPSPPVETSDSQPKQKAEERSVITVRTRNIAALAARRRNKVQVEEPTPFFLTQPSSSERKKDSDNYLTQSRLAQHNQKFGSSFILTQVDQDIFSSENNMAPVLKPTPKKNIFQQGPHKKPKGVQKKKKKVPTATLR